MKFLFYFSIALRKYPEKKKLRGERIWFVLAQITSFQVAVCCPGKIKAGTNLGDRVSKKVGSVPGDYT